MRENDIGTKVIEAAITVHRELGPGLLETVYEVILARELSDLGLKTSAAIDRPRAGGDRRRFSGRSVGSERGGGLGGGGLYAGGAAGLDPDADVSGLRRDRLQAYLHFIRPHKSYTCWTARDGGPTPPPGASGGPALPPLRTKAEVPLERWRKPSPRPAIPLFRRSRPVEQSIWRWTTERLTLTRIFHTIRAIPPPLLSRPSAILHFPPPPPRGWGAFFP